MIGDLHCHTRCSDGSLPVEQLVYYAKRAGLDFIAVTDHDTMAGVDRAIELGKRYGIHVIAGAEMSCVDNSRGRKVHILCYEPDRRECLRPIFNQALDSRTRAGREMIRLVTQLYPATEEHMLRYASESESIYKVHILQALMDLGYDNQVYGRVFHNLFGKEGRCSRPIYYPDVLEALDAVHHSGGIAVLAHPTVYDSMDLLEELAAAGLIDGVEAYHPRVSDDATERILDIAEEYDLIVTGGSDFHGMYSPNPQPIASRITTDEGLLGLYARKNSKKSNA